MTLMIILGGVAAFYLIWLLFRLAAFALPVYAGAGTALLLRAEGYGIAAVLGMGFMTGLAVHLAGQLLFARARSPLLRLLFTLIFTVPAAIAGYQAMTGLAGLLFDDSFWARCLSVAGGVVTASAAWQASQAERRAGVTGKRCRTRRRPPFRLRWADPFP